MLQVQPIVDKTTRFDRKWKQSGFVGKHFRYFQPILEGCNIFNQYLRGLQRMRVVSIKPLFVKCMSQYFQGRKKNDIASTVINIFRKGKKKYCKYCYCMSQYFQERKENDIANTVITIFPEKKEIILQILLLYVPIFFGKERKCIENIVINICIYCYCMSQYFLKGKKWYWKYCY